MGWRIVYITSGDKMTISLNQLIISRTNDKISIPLEDIDTLVLEDTHTLISTTALVRLCEFKINVLLCNDKHDPCLTFLPITGYFRQGKRVNEQAAWAEDKKSVLWQQIVIHKILNQAAVSEYFEQISSALKLKTYAKDVLENDKTMREAAAAKLYFRSVFGKDFIRGADDVINAALNYGYTIILSCFNRSLAAKGLLPYWGIKHAGEYNAFNLSCDLIEPFRPFVDFWVLKYIVPAAAENPPFKSGLVALLGAEVYINGRKEKMHNAIDLFCDECASFLAGRRTISNVHFPCFSDTWWRNAI